MKPSRKIAVVGGVAGGASAAARARRLDESLDGSGFEDVANLRGGFLQALLNGFDSHSAVQP